MKYEEIGELAMVELVERGVAGDLADLIAALAEVGARIGDQELGSRFDEDGLSALVHERMSRMLPNLEIIDNRGKKSEFKTGSDWEWWIEGDVKWFHALVQAKKLHHESLEYDLAYKSGGRLQAAKLVEASRRMSPPAAPLYVLYNERPESYAATLGCPGESFIEQLLRRLSYSPALARGITVIAGEAALMLAIETGCVRGESVSEVAVDQVAEVAASWVCLAACPSTECGDLAFWRPWPLRPLEVLWSALGLEGECNPSDLAFLMARAYSTTGFHGRWPVRRSALATARASLIEDPSDYLLDSEVAASDRFEGLDPEFVPRWTMVLRRSREQGAD